MDFEKHVSNLVEEGRSNLRASLGNPQTGLEAENIHLHNGNRFVKKHSAVTTESFEETLEELGLLDGTTLKREPEGTPKEVKFGEPIGIGEDWKPEFTYDYGPQGEIGTQPLSNLDEVANQKEEIEQRAEEMSPDDTSFYQIALTPNLMLRDEEFDDVIDWDVDDKTDASSFRNPCLRYGSIKDTYGPSSIIIGGAQGLQVSGVPRVSGNIDEINVDDIVTGFQKGIGDLPGVPAFNTVFYALSESGATISEEGEIVNFHERDEAYRQRFGKSNIVPDSIGKEKHGYLPKFSEAEGIEEIVRQNSEELLEYTASAPLTAFDAEEDIETLAEEYGYSLDDEFSMVLIDEDFESIEESDSPVTHREIVEQGYAEGYIRLEDEDGEEHTETVTLDLDNLEDPDEFLEKNYMQAESMNKPNIRFRLGYGCFENRDQDNTPEWQAALGIQEGKMRNWLKFQRAAYNEGFRNEHAEYLREQHREKGLEAELHPDTDTTILDFVEEHQDLFTEAIDPVDEPETYEATSQYIEGILNGKPTPAEEAAEDYEEFMERAKVSS